VPIPYGRQSIDDADIQAVVDVLKSDWLTIGPKVAEFESAVARVAGTEDATVVSSGTAALHAAYVGLGLQRGAEVITTPLTFVATSATAMAEGATMTFVDVQEDTGNLDPSAVAAAISEKTAVVAAVDFGGHPADLDELAEIAHGAGALLLEDAAHSIGGSYKGRPVGSIADVTSFSFFPTKNLTSGEGGAVASPDASVVKRARLFRGQGLVRDAAEHRHPGDGDWYYEVHEVGLNYRLPDVLCALGISQIARLAAFKNRRTAIFERYHDGLADLDAVRLPVRRDDVDPMWHLFPARVPADQRRRVFDFLRQNDVLVQVNYIPTHWLPAFEDLGYRRGQCPVAEQYYREEISLPMYADLTPSDQDRVIELLHTALS
jgi:dTDP-4-amino-4,6-dideoxygalactose transaminase